MSMNQELEGDITREGALAPLIDLMDHTEPKIQIQAAVSVRNLSITPDSKVTVVEQGALPILCKLIKSGDLRLVEQAAIIFRNLSVNAENKIKIMATEGAKALVDLLKPLTKADESLDADTKALKVKIQEQSAGVLRNLSMHNDNKVPPNAFILFIVFQSHLSLAGQAHELIVGHRVLKTSQRHKRSTCARASVRYSAKSFDKQHGRRPNLQRRSSRGHHCPS